MFLSRGDRDLEVAFQTHPGSSISMSSMVPVALIEAVLSVWRLVVGRPRARESQRDTPGELGRVSHHPLTVPQSP